MTYLSKFSLGNFRVFKDMTDFEFAPITILTGTNSSGKSSLIKAIMLLKDNIENNWEEKKRMTNTILTKEIPLFDTLSFNSAIHNLASFENSKNRRSGKNEIQFRLPIDLGIGEESFLHLNYVKALNNDRTYGELNRVTILTENEKTILFDIARLDNKDWIFKADFQYLRKRIDLIANKKINKSDLNTRDVSWGGKLLHNSSVSKKSIMDIDHNKYYSALPINFYPLKGFDVYLDSSAPKDNQQYKLNFEFYSDLFGVNHQNDLSLNYIISFVAQNYSKLLSDFKELLGELGFDIDNDKEILNTLIEGEVLLLSLDQSNNYFKKWTTGEGELDSIVFNQKYLRVQLNDISNSILSISVDDKHLNNIELIKDISPKSYAIFNVLKNLLDSYPEYRLAYKMMGLQFVQNFYYFFSDLIFNKLFDALADAPKPLKSIYFLEAVRANTQRAYSFQSQGTSFNELLKRFEELNIEDESNEIRFVNKWIRVFGLGQNLRLVQNPDGLGMHIYIDDLLLADSGYGITQFLPVLLKIAIVAKENWNVTYLLPDHVKKGNEYEYLPSTIIIEEPETNLHPRLQSMLADLMVDAATRFHIQFIIETHSEYLIRKLQYLTANKEHDYNIKPEDTAIYYFNDPKTFKKGEEQVKRIRIREDGILDGSFGSGFFDEASNLIKEIFKLSGAN